MIATLIIFGIFNLLSFIIGFYFGSDKKITIPKIIDKYIKERKPTEEEQKYLTILDNIDNYDGTELGQKEV